MDYSAFNIDNVPIYTKKNRYRHKPVPGEIIQIFGNACGRNKTAEIHIDRNGFPTAFINDWSKTWFIDVKLPRLLAKIQEMAGLTAETTTSLPARRLSTSSPAETPPATRRRILSVEDDGNYDWDPGYDGGSLEDPGNFETEQSSSNSGENRNVSGLNPPLRIPSSEIALADTIFDCVETRMSPENFNSYHGKFSIPHTYARIDNFCNRNRLVYIARREKIRADGGIDLSNQLVFIGFCLLEFNGGHRQIVSFCTCQDECYSYVGNYIHRQRFSCNLKDFFPSPPPFTSCHHTQILLHYLTRNTNARLQYQLLVNHFPSTGITETTIPATPQLTTVQISNGQPVYAVFAADEFVAFIRDRNGKPVCKDCGTSSRRRCRHINSASPITAPISEQVEMGQSQQSVNININRSVEKVKLFSKQKYRWHESNGDIRFCESVTAGHTRTWPPLHFQPERSSCELCSAALTMRSSQTQLLLFLTLPARYLASLLPQRNAVAAE